MEIKFSRGSMAVALLILAAAFLGETVLLQNAILNAQLDHQTASDLLALARIVVGVTVFCQIALLVIWGLYVWLAVTNDRDLTRLEQRVHSGLLDAGLPADQIAPVMRTVRARLDGLLPRDSGLMQPIDALPEQPALFDDLTVAAR